MGVLNESLVLTGEGGENDVRFPPESLGVLFLNSSSLDRDFESQKLSLSFVLGLPYAIKVGEHAEQLAPLTRSGV